MQATHNVALIWNGDDTLDPKVYCTIAMQRRNAGLTPIMGGNQGVVHFATYCAYKGVLRGNYKS